MFGRACDDARGRWRVDRAAIRADAQRIVADYDVRCRGLDQPTRQLSGGNMQKLILGRVLSRAPRLIVADQPTWGLDVGAVEAIYNHIRSAAARGVGVLLISSELDELLSVAHRVVVLYRGRVMGICRADRDERQRIGAWMAGQQEHTA